MMMLFEWVPGLDPDGIDGVAMLHFSHTNPDSSQPVAFDSVKSAITLVDSVNKALRQAHKNGGQEMALQIERLAARSRARYE